MSSEFKSLIGNNSPTVSAKTMKDVILKYLSYYPLFIVSLLLCAAAAYVKIRYTVPLYAGSTVINVNGETSNSKSGSSGNGGDLINNAMNGGRPVINLDNELGRLRSAKLMERVVRNSDLNVSYFRKGKILTTDIYHDAPFRLIIREIQDSSRKISMELTGLSAWGTTVTYGPEANPKQIAVPWNTPFIINHNTYTLSPLAGAFNKNETYIVEWSPVEMAMYELLPKVAVNVIGKTSNIQLNVTIENPSRGEDVLNKMVSEFIQMNLDDQNRDAQNKVQFIEERLETVASELRSVDGSYANYQGENMLINGQDPTAQFGTSIGESAKLSNDLNSQIKVLDMVRQYVTDPASANKVIPSTLGVGDEVLKSLVEKYNELALTRQRETPLVAGNSLVLKDLDNQIAVLRSSIVDNLQSLDKGLKMQLANISKQNSQVKATISKLPQKEKVLEGIAREKSVKENLYLYLLQKREETALSKTTTSPYYQIDLATSYGPVEPNQKTIYQYAIILGLIIPVVIISVKEMLTDKITGREEIERQTHIPIVGEISNIKKLKKIVLPALEGGLIGEQFRIIRANLAFLQKGMDKQVVLVTSTSSGEGKSFISLNLASMIAKSGKKVALLEFDLRKEPDSPLSVFHGPGITQYLTGEAALSEIAQTMEGLPTLDIYPTGHVAAEAGDLMISEKLPNLFERLKQQYDVLIVNTAPVGLVSDGLVISHYCNLVAYILRQDYSSKKSMRFLNDLVKTEKFKSACIIFNGVKTGSKYGYYGYGYGTRKNSYFNNKGKSKKTGLLVKKKESTVSV